MRTSTNRAESMPILVGVALACCLAVGLFFQNCWADSVAVIEPRPLQTLDISRLEDQRQMRGSPEAFIFQAQNSFKASESTAIEDILNWLGLKESQKRVQKIGGVDQSQPQGLDLRFHVPSHVQYFLEHPAAVFDRDSRPIGIYENAWGNDFVPFFNAVAL